MVTHNVLKIFLEIKLEIDVEAIILNCDQPKSRQSYESNTELVKIKMRKDKFASINGFAVLNRVDQYCYTF